MGPKHININLHLLYHQLNACSLPWQHNAYNGITNVQLNRFGDKTSPIPQRESPEKEFVKWRHFLQLIYIPNSEQHQLL